MRRNPIVLDERPADRVADRAGGGASLPAVVLVSNRGPVEYQLVDGTPVARRGSGGVVTALDALARRLRGTWVATALTDADRLIAGRGRLAPTDGRAMGVRLVALDPAVARRHYLRFSNPLLWFLHHGLFDLLQEPLSPARVRSDWWEGYVPANRALADAAIAEAIALGVGGTPVLAVHDYQLYLVPGFVRKALPHIPIQHFVHIPWPEPAAWRQLPREIVRSIGESLLACDVVGFQTADAADRFVETCLTFLPGATSPYPGVVAWQGRTTRVATYPISIDVAVLRQQCASAACQQYRRRLLAGWDGQTIVRVDRVDPSKNLLRGFTAYDRLLRQRPDLRGRVRLLAFLVPSRSAIPEYRTYADAVLAAIDAINAEHGTPDWRPVQAFYENNYLQALAGMMVADVIFVNPVADGMNLVAKESVVVNERDAVLVLSQTAGAYAELGPAALGIPPDDVEATAKALERALAMPPAERRRRAAWLRRFVEEHDVQRWLQIQLDDLAALMPRAGRSARLPDPAGLADVAPSRWHADWLDVADLIGDEQ